MLVNVQGRLPVEVTAVRVKGARQAHGKVAHTRCCGNTETLYFLVTPCRAAGRILERFRVGG